MTYGAEMWDVSGKNGNKLIVTEMCYPRRTSGRTTLERIRNETITEMLEMEKNIEDDVRMVWTHQ
jgi:hypothetical protein